MRTPTTIRGRFWLLEADQHGRAPDPESTPATPQPEGCPVDVDPVRGSQPARCAGQPASANALEFWPIAKADLEGELNG